MDQLDPFKVHFKANLEYVLSSIYSWANLAYLEGTAPLKSLLMPHIFSEFSLLGPWVTSRKCPSYNSSLTVSLEVFLDYLCKVLPYTCSDWYSAKNLREFYYISRTLFGLAPPHNYLVPWPFWTPVSVSSIQRLPDSVWIPPPLHHAPGITSR